MMLFHGDIGEPIVFREGEIPVLVVESPLLMRSMIADLLQQGSGEDGEFVLSDDDVPVSFIKKADFVTDVHALSFSSKTVQTAIQKHLSQIAKDLFPVEEARLLSEINAFGASLLPQTEWELSFRGVSDISHIIKILDYYIDTADLSFPERILEYIRLNRIFCKKELFIFLNLKSFCSANELRQLYQTLIYRKEHILLLESFSLPSVDKREVIRIIDEDFCLI